MNKVITSVAVLLTALAFTACSQPTVEQKLEEYKAAQEAISTQLRADFEAVAADETLTEEQAGEKQEAIYEKAIEDLKALGLKTVKKNRDNEVGVSALKDVMYYLEDDELEKVIASLSKENQENSDIQKISASLQARKRTAVGQPFVDFEVDGVRFSDFVGKGKYILVDFWASWCGPCKREIPNIKDVYETYHGADFDVLSVAVWDKPEDTAKAAEEHGVAWNQIVNAQRIASDAYGFNSIPQIMLFGPDGTVLAKGDDLRGAEMKATVAKFLGR